MSINYHTCTREPEFKPGDLVRTRVAQLAAVVLPDQAVGFEYLLQFADGKSGYQGKWIEELPAERVSTRDLHPYSSVPCDGCAAPIYSGEDAYHVNDWICCSKTCAKQQLTN